MMTPDASLRSTAERPSGVADAAMDMRDAMRASGHPRVTRTRQAILDAVERLVADASAPVTVSALVKTAGISRSSFYTHFAGLDELAASVLQGAFGEIGSADLELRRRAGMSGAQAAHIAFERLVAHLDDHRALYTSVFDLPVASTTSDSITAAYAEQVLATISVLADVPADVDPQLTARFIAGGVLTVIRAWLRGDVSASRVQLVARLLALLPAWLSNPPDTGTRRAAPLL